MIEQTQTGAEITISAEQLKEIRTYLGDQPAKFSNPLLTFFAQLEAEAASKLSKAQSTQSDANKETSTETTEKETDSKRKFRKA